MAFLLITAFLLAGCSASLGSSLDSRYDDAYQAVVKDPNAENVATYMQLSQQMADRDMKKANSAAEAATKESDKGLTEYFKRYGSESFRKNSR